MSTTIYDSPDEAIPNLSIDITHSLVWFFEEAADGKPMTEARVSVEELPAIHKAIGDYLEAVKP